MQRLSLCALVALAFLMTLVSGRARADGLIIIENPTPVPGHFPFAPLEVTYHRVNVEIDDRVATTSVDQEFRNPANVRTEGTYLFPLPPGAHIDKFSMDINGRQTEAELLPADKARSIYEDIVRKMRDPALLEYAGRDAFKVRVFPIEPYGTKHIKIRYTQLLKEDNGLVEYSYPLNTEKFSSRLIPDVSVTVHVRSPDPLKNVYCPSHPAEIKRDNAREATIGYEAKNARPDTDFKLLFSRESKPVGIKLLTYNRPGDDMGYFMLMASPGVGLGSSLDTAPAKDIAFVLDTSGSMADRGKIEQAKRALNYCLANLNEGDRFDIVRFSTEAGTLFGELRPASKGNVDRARSYVSGLKPTGGTAIDAALSRGLALRDRSEGSSRPFLMVFLTDGAPTVGATDEDQIVQHATSQALGARVFCFGIGQDVNTHLLDRIADATRATSTYVLPDEDIEVKVAGFYEKVKEPVMSDVRLAFEGASDVHTSQLYPNALPDLFKGDTLLVFGRYSGAGAGSVKLSGYVDGKRQDFVEDVRFADNNEAHAFIPMMWATRRVGWLLDEIRQHGESRELKDEVVRLSREHGIVTPYTAYLIIEDETRRNVPELSRTMREMEKDREALGRARGAYDSTVAEAARQEARSGPQAVDNAQALGGMKYQMQASSQPAAALAKAPAMDVTGVGAGGGAVNGYRTAQNYAQQVKLVRGRAFYQNGDTWSDSTAQSKRDLKQKTIKFNSDDYFALLRAHPDATQWLALGNNVDVVLDDTLYSVRDN